jgi:hypothetical protein
VALGVLLFQIAILDTGGEAEVRWCAFRRETRQEALACTGGTLSWSACSNLRCMVNWDASFSSALASYHVTQRDFFKIEK